MGERCLELAYHSISSPAVVILVQGILMGLLGLFVLLIRKRVEPEAKRIS